MTVLDVVRLVAGWLAVALAPGALLALALKPRLRRDPAALAGLSAPLSVGLVFVAAQLCDVAAVRFGAWALPVLLAPTALLAWRRRHASGEPLVDRSHVTVATPARAAVLVALAGVVAGLAVWGLALRGVTSVPPNRDAKNHGFFVARIVDTGTIDPARVLVTDPVSEEPAAEFYPLAFHASAALARDVAGGPIAGLLTAWTALFAAVVTPLGLYALLRRLVPERPLVAGFAALVTPFLALFPNRPILWGGLSLIVGVALVPPALALLADAVTDTGPAPGGPDAKRRPREADGRWAAVALGAVAVTGAVATHSSQAAFLAVLAVPVLGFLLWARRDPPTRLARAAGSLAVTALAAAVLYLPTIRLLASGASERADIRGANNLGFPEALGRIVTLSVNTPAIPLVVLVLVLGGIGYAVRHAIAPSWMVAGAMCLVLFLASATPDGIWEGLRPLSAPWYWSYERTSYHLPMFAAFFVACALDGLTRGIDRFTRVRGSRPLPAWVPLVTVAALFVVAATPGGLRSSYDMVRLAYVEYTNIADGERAAFAYAAEHDCGAVVVNQEQDGSPWMYALEGLHPLQAIAPVEESRRWREAGYLLDHVDEYTTDARARQLLERFDACYVYTGQPLATEGVTLDPAVLAEADGLQEVGPPGRFGRARLFRITGR